MVQAGVQKSLSSTLLDIKCYSSLRSMIKTLFALVLTSLPAYTLLFALFLAYTLCCFAPRFIAVFRFVSHMKATLSQKPRFNAARLSSTRRFVLRLKRSSLCSSPKYYLSLRSSPTKSCVSRLSTISYIASLRYWSFRFVRIRPGEALNICTEKCLAIVVAILSLKKLVLLRLDKPLAGIVFTHRNGC